MTIGKFLGCDKGFDGRPPSALGLYIVAMMLFLLCFIGGGLPTALFGVGIFCCGLLVSWMNVGNGPTKIEWPWIENKKIEHEHKWGFYPGMRVCGECRKQEINPKKENV